MCVASARRGSELDFFQSASAGSSLYELDGMYRTCCMLAFILFFSSESITLMPDAEPPETTPQEVQSLLRLTNTMPHVANSHPVQPSSEQELEEEICDIYVAKACRLACAFRQSGLSLSVNRLNRYHVTVTSSGTQLRSGMIVTPPSAAGSVLCRRT